jgi:hypothetical protein
LYANQIININFHHNSQGCKRKFDVARFVSKYPPAAANAAKAGGGAPAKKGAKK